MEQTVLNKSPYVQISVCEEQKVFARKLVEYSLLNHRVSNIWDKHQNSLAQTRTMRYTGTLGEIVFADCYHLPRPTRSFGAVDGQDFGQDFLIRAEHQNFSVDVKSMKRRSGNLGKDYVLNIPASQLHKRDSKTSHYFCISFHQSEMEGTIASLLGFIDKHALQQGDTGTLFEAGRKRVRDNGTTFIFNENTYEVPFWHIDPPVVTDFIRRIKGFRLKTLQ